MRQKGPGSGGKGRYRCLYHSPALEGDSCGAYLSDLSERFYISYVSLPNLVINNH